MNKEVKEIFEQYCELVNSDEAAAILTLADVLKGKRPYRRRQSTAVNELRDEMLPAEQLTAG